MFEGLPTDTQDMRVIYVNFAESATTHLARADAFATQNFTLCGRQITGTNHSFGDETVSAIAATCRKCSRLHRNS